MPTSNFFLFPLAAIAFLTACGAPVPEAAAAEETATTDDSAGAEETSLADIELCDARDYRPLIGTNVASATLPVGPMLRAYGVDDIVTQEYIPQRTNVVFDADGVIVRVWCG